MSDRGGYESNPMKHCTSNSEQTQCPGRAPCWGNYFISWRTLLKHNHSLLVARFCWFITWHSASPGRQAVGVPHLRAWIQLPQKGPACFGGCAQSLTPNDPRSNPSPISFQLSLSSRVCKGEEYPPRRVDMRIQTIMQEKHAGSVPP